ncbi:hypothetical protein LCM10_04050 [Rossellomorea aquimaris]|uniref:hypothetical protein n=1 Tax=Rossellomorea aquimaris TaxID=189382 RepID=UPI001CD6B2B8|nr:hypothetical protein [Rossellomorea aquimaris]MCA1054149.1 hypothetical protein [Rossellomorea aquimaris]
MKAKRTSLFTLALSCVLLFACENIDRSKDPAEEKVSVNAFEDRTILIETFFLNDKIYELSIRGVL